MKQSEAIDPKLEAFIATRDRRVAKVYQHSPTRLTDAFQSLLANGEVTVGGRASCGGRTDPTWVEFTAWNEIVQKARQLGYAIEEEEIKHGNGWASKAGGFWNERKYTLPVAVSLEPLSEEGA